MNFLYLQPQSMMLNNYSIAPLLTPGYTFNQKDIIGLGSTLLFKLEDDRKRLEQVIQEELKPVKKPEITKQELDYKKISELIDKAELEKGHINKVVNEIIKNNDKLYKTVEQKDALYRFVRTVMYLNTTRKLLTNSPELLKNMFIEVGIDVNRADIKKYLDEIKKGVEKVNSLNDLINKENIILTDEQNLVVLNYLKLVLENFVSVPK
jgi:hypothetical protein